MKTMLSLLPFAVGLAVFAVVVWFLVSREMALGTWLFAAFLLAHGLVQLVFLVPQPQSPPSAAGGAGWPFDMANSWTIRGPGLQPGLVRAVGVALVLLVAVGFALAALATVGLLIPQSWWAPLVVGSTVASTTLLVLFFSPSLILGFGINAVLIWVVLASGWSPAASSASV